MPRLFLTPRELNFMSDIAKELVKDVMGNEIYYYSISEVKTKMDGVYGESSKKVFNNPIAIEAMVASPQGTSNVTEFSVDETWKIEAWVQYRDLVEKGIEISMGDFFSFGDVMYEIVGLNFPRNIYGLPEHKNSVHIEGVNARESLFKTKLVGPTDIKYTDSDAIKKDFEAPFGRERFDNGEETNDKRALIDNGLIETEAIHGSGSYSYSYPTNEQTREEEIRIDSAFYGDEEG